MRVTYLLGVISARIVPGATRTANHGHAAVSQRTFRAFLPIRGAGANVRSRGATSFLGAYSGAMEWDHEAEARMKKAPFFIRPFIKGRAEKEAKARGLTKVTCALLDELKQSEHRGTT